MLYAAREALVADCRLTMTPVGKFSSTAKIEMMKQWLYRLETVEKLLIFFRMISICCHRVNMKSSHFNMEN